MRPIPTSRRPRPRSSSACFSAARVEQPADERWLLAMYRGAGLRYTATAEFDGGSR